MSKRNSGEIEKRIQEYESLLHNLKMTYLEDDHAWKNIVEDLVKILAEDRIEVLKNKKGGERKNEIS